MKDIPKIFLVGVTDSYEFLKREFEWKVINFDKKSIDWSSETKIVLAFDFANIEKAMCIILEFPEHQFILILLGNETQQLKILRQLARIERVLAIYSQYDPQPLIFGGMKTSLIQLIDSPRTFFNFNFFMICLRGAYRGLKSIVFARIPKIKHFPLGYSNRFIEELLLSGLISIESMTIMQLSNSFSNRSRKSEVIFKGQLTGQYRKLIAPYLMQKELVKFELNQQWGRPELLTSTSYVKSMIESKFVFCPPGHVSNDTFRRTEALICGALPIEIESSPQNWQKCYTSFADTQLNRYSVVRSVREALKMPETDRHRIRVFLLNKMIGEIVEVTKNIENQMTSA
jgi:hypothetical protein